eukprot:gene12614-12704_t
MAVGLPQELSVLARLCFPSSRFVRRRKPIVITASCTINTGTLTFPSTPGTSLVSAAVTANTTVSLSCTTGSSYSVAMDSGSNSLASQRRMKSGTNYINYNLFTDAAYLNAWTTVTNSTTCTTLNSCSLGLGTGLAQTISVFGQVPAVATAPAPGTYTDTVTMTINY